MRERVLYGTLLGWALLCVAPSFLTPLRAQESIDLALAYPNTTMVYARMEAAELSALLDPDELLAGLEAELPIPDLNQIISERLELSLTDAEVRALLTQMKRVSVGLLDVGVSGPKLQFVIEHANPAPLARALKQAHDEGAMTVTGSFTHEDRLVYQVYLPLTPTQTDPNDWGRVDPFSSWTDEQDFCICVFDNRYIIVTNNESAIRDSIDFLAFPDDPIDTLKGNKRYTEALQKFEGALGVIFVNVQAVINALERVAGDKGSASLFQELVSWWIPAETLEFVTNLLQYEQFKSFAAGIWLDDAKLTLRLDATFNFHHAPAWFKALRISPDVVPLTEYIPADAALAFTDCVQDAGSVYSGFRDFVLTRARNAGRTEVVEAWEKFEADNAADGCPIDELLGQIGGGQALVLMPHSRASDPWEYRVMPWDAAGLIGLKERKPAQDFLFERLLPSQVGRMLRDAEGDWSPVTVIHGIEVHHDLKGDIAFAIIPRGEKAGVLAVGSLAALRHIINSHADKTHLKSLATWTEAQGLLWPKQSLGMYLNLGAVLKSSQDTIDQFDRWGRWEPEAEFKSRDDTSEDKNTTPLLAKFFANTVLVGAVNSGESHSDMRLAAAGWPNRDSFRQLSRTFGDIERNRKVRDDMLRIRQSALTAWAVSGKGATSVDELRKRGLLRADDAVDPYGPDANLEGELLERPYLLAPVSEKLDVRQAVLCAYQAKPGLGGKHLAILWNNDVVKLTPEQLQSAISRAKEARAIDDPMYASPVPPLHSQADSRPKYDPELTEGARIRLDVIEKDGTEKAETVDDGAAIDQTEKILDRKRDEGK